ncbi:hypothetical protein [Demequina oxidasica]|uniref:hypothetical protein n=1 Tax=Demequina oxidasica TaxID=676199 RepID=UPI000780A9F9|nr:hypothetical protein [Demequina oxidasica]
MTPDIRVVNPPDCGNAPRKAIVRDLVMALAGGDSSVLDAYLHGDAIWALVGDQTIRGGDHVKSRASSAAVAAEIRFESLLTHGPAASASGTVTHASGARTHFSHVVRFASAGKAAPVISMTSYLIAATPTD